MDFKKNIENFNQQFLFKPVIVNKPQKKYKKFIVNGMGGSHLAADLFKLWQNKIDLIIEKNYNLPLLPDIKNRLVILSSYSGNTAEIIYCFDFCKKNHLPVFIISSGGKLLTLAKKYKLPYIQLLSGFQPRQATGLMFTALTQIIIPQHFSEVKSLSQLQPKNFEEKGKNIAKFIKGLIPIIYSSEINLPLAYYWKINFNETSKVPAFYNILPEANHNELNSFNLKTDYKKFGFIFLQDSNDSKFINKRFDVLTQLYKSFKIISIKLGQNSQLTAIFNNVILSQWSSYYLAQLLRHNPDKVELIEKFKKLLH
ncbi:MAG: bifunctional phosphoglucose/phosphomannose isomerase [Minisyncoccia bacterium]